jgi:hypothetical protein
MHADNNKSTQNGKNGKSRALQAGAAAAAGALLALALQGSAGNQATQRMSRTTQRRKDVADIGRMPLEVQTRMESVFNADLSDVKIYPNSAKAVAIGAQAYTRGTDIHIAPGHYDPYSRSGLELLGHELAHVVQQKNGKVTPTGRMADGTLVNNNAGFEGEAERMGKIAANASLPCYMPLQRKVDKPDAKPEPKWGESLIIQRSRHPN